MVEIAARKTSRFIRSIKFTASVMLLAIILNFILSTFFNIHLVSIAQERLGFSDTNDNGNYQVLPENEHAVLAASKTDLNFKRSNSDEIQNSRSKNQEIYMYFVQLTNGTMFEFGLKDKQDVRPVVKVTNKEGLFVQYAPIGFEKMNVAPDVKKNVLEWYISEGILARYTMMSDRVKADYIVESKADIENYRMNFDLEYSNELKPENLPSNDLAFLEESGFQAFIFPEPEIYDAERTRFTGEYELSSDTLSIVLPKAKVENAVFPLTIDPVTIDSSATTIGTAYGNGRKILRDAYGNLIVCLDGGIGDNCYFKKHNTSTWSIDMDLDGSSSTSSTEISLDIDSSGTLHTAFWDGTQLWYKKLTVTRDGTNAVTNLSIANAAILDSSGFGRRPSLVVANKGAGSGKEAAVVAWASNSSSGGTRRGEMRVAQCEISASSCTTVDNWENLSEEMTGTGGSAGCNNTATSGNAGMANAVDCKGVADALFQFTAVHTIHHGVITQMQGNPKRSPNSVKIDNNGTFTTLTNANDVNTSTTADISSVADQFGVNDFLYVGDGAKFSKVSIDIGDTAGDNNSNAATLPSTTVEYCSANTDTATACDTWSDLSNFVDYTATSTVSFSEDGSLLFDESTNWVQSTENNVQKYWVRFRPTSNFDTVVKVKEMYVTDRNSNALVVIGGVDDTDDLRAAYIPWDEIQNDRWENRPDQAGNGWRQDSGGSFSALTDTGANWITFTNYPLSATIDYTNNVLYIAYICSPNCDQVANDNQLQVKTLSYNKAVTEANNWTSNFSTLLSEQADMNLSLTSDGSDIYLFYVLDPDTTSLVYRKCTPSNGGDTSLCDNASDWESEQTLVPFVSTTNEPSHPQAVVSKGFGDTVAIDVIYTDLLTTPAVEYERHYVDMADNTITVAASGDDAYEKCTAANGGAADQTVTSTEVLIGYYMDSFSGCTTEGISVDSQVHGGFRFQNVPISQGAKISSAYLDVRVVTVPTSSINSITIYGEDTDTSAAFTAQTDCSGNSNCISVRSRTSSSNNYNTLYTSNTYRFNVTEIVQEIVCRGAGNAQPCVGDFSSNGNWSSGNALAMLFISTHTDSINNLVGFAANDSNPELKPTLHVNCEGSCSSPTGYTDKNYSSGVISLPTGLGSYSDLDHPLSASEVVAVDTDDTSYASIANNMNAQNNSNAVPVFQFKIHNSNNNNTYKFDASAIIKSSIPTTSKTAYLQVYRGGSTNDWETVDSDSTTAADTDITFDPVEISTNVSEYYFAESGSGVACGTSSTNCWTYWRIYQPNASDTGGSQILSVDYFNLSYSANGPSKVGFSNSVRTLSESVCNGTAKVFTMELQDASDNSINPLTETVVRVTSNSTDYTVYSDSACTSEVANGDFIYTTSQNSKNVYIIDHEPSTTTRTLTGTRQSGDTLTVGTQNYTVSEVTDRVRGGSHIRGGARL